MNVKWGLFDGGTRESDAEQRRLMGRMNTIKVLYMLV
jgi:hypothetical protein